jgi:hypothetical protein
MKMSSGVNLEFYLKVYKYHEKNATSTNDRQKFWKEYQDELVKKQINRKNDLGWSDAGSGWFNDANSTS